MKNVILYYKTDNELMFQPELNQYPLGNFFFVSHSIMSNSWATPWTVAHQGPLSMKCSRKENWNGYLPGDLPNPGIEPRSPILACIQFSQKAAEVVWSSHLFKNFPQFVLIHIVKGSGVVNEAEVNAFLEFSCFSYVQ